MIDIKGVRKSLKLTQDQFAKLFGVTQVYISQIENGKSMPSEDLLTSLKDYIHENNIDIKNIVEEPHVLYHQKKASPEDLHAFNVADRIYRVAEMNSLDDYRQGDVLSLQRIQKDSFIPFGRPYLINTVDGLDIITVIQGIDTDSNAYQIIISRDPHIVQPIPIDQINDIFVVKSLIRHKT